MKHYIRTQKKIDKKSSLTEKEKLKLQEINDQKRLRFLTNK
jgi:hypothetical protein